MVFIFRSGLIGRRLKPSSRYGFERGGHQQSRRQRLAVYKHQSKCTYNQPYDRRHPALTESIVLNGQDKSDKNRRN